MVYRSDLVAFRRYPETCILFLVPKKKGSVSEVTSFLCVQFSFAKDL